MRIRLYLDRDAREVELSKNEAESRSNSDSEDEGEEEVWGDIENNNDDVVSQRNRSEWVQGTYF